MDLNHSPTGRIIKLPSGYTAFIPHPPPPHFDWDNPLVHALSKANYFLGKLALEGKKLPNPHLLIRLFITREAVLSSKIEGTQATVGEILAKEAGAHVERHPNDLQEVENYILALDHGLELLGTLPLSLRLLKELHNKLMRGVRGNHATPGEFRRSQNWIGPAGCTLNSAKYVPPPPETLMDSLGQLEIFFHDRQLPKLVHIAICHYQFEAIHPFLDGNGRVGRLLITLFLVERNLLPSPLLYLSAFFEATRDEYYRQLYNVTARGSWNDWLIYFLNGVALQSEDALSRAERINQLLYQWTIQITNGSSQVPEKIIRHFAINPFLTIKKVAKELDVAYSTAKRGVVKLESQGIIKQTNQNSRDKVFCATEILDILEEPAKIFANFENGF